MILAWIGVLLAADLSSYPLVAPVTLPATGPAAVPLRGDAVGADPELATAGILVVDAVGQEVPYTVVPARDASPEREVLSRSPIGASTWETGTSDRPLDELDLDFDDLSRVGPQRVTVSAFEHGGWVTVAEELLFDLEGDPAWERTTVPVGLRRGPFRISVTPVGRRRADLDRVEGVVLPDRVVEPLVESLDAPPPSYTDEGMVQYVFPLPGPRTVTDVHFRVEGDLFERRVRLGTPDEVGGVSVRNEGTVQRIELAGTRLDRVDLHGLDLRGDVLVVEVATDRGRTLPLVGIDITSVAMELLVRDAGAGPHQVFLAGREEPRPYDLGVGAYELLRLAPPVAELGEVGPNPDYLPLPTREGVDAAGTLVNRARFRWERPIEGEGWLRIPLDRLALGHARPDLSDVRVVDGQGAQVPYLVRPGRGTLAWETPAFTREEDPTTGDTLLRVPLGGDDVPVEWVTLTTTVDTFSRDVSLVRDRGRTTETVRRVTWSGAEQGRRLTMSVGERLGAEVLIRIANGDNAPIPIDAVQVGGPSRDLVAHVVGPGAHLLYGAPGEHRPQYDLYLLEAEVQRIPLVEATLGEEVAVAGPALSGFDRTVVLGTVGVLALGLVLLTIRVLRAVPAPEAPADEAATS